ncbi:MAG: PIN domain-containing protein [Pseudomonadota bacterium]|nr:PIN domain-containing protein [Pseudomonadota bacterium]
MTLVDTSVWIDFFRGHDTLQVTLLESLLIRGEDIATCGLVLTEILQGIADEQQFVVTETRFHDLIFLPVEREIFVSAAQIYRTLCRQGFAVQKPMNCTLAAIAIKYNAEFLHNDRDFDAIAIHFPLQLIDNEN